LFAQLVNDPGYERSLQRGVNKEQAARERERLFGIIEKLVQWENTNNEAVLSEARAEIWKSWRETCELNKNHPQAAELFNPDELPAFHDPFAGGGAIPLEAQRLGLKSYASDLNPVAVTINKAMIEIPPKFAGRAPVGPLPPGEKQDRMAQSWPGASGLAEDVRRYGAWMRIEAEKHIGHLYPKVEVTAQMAENRPDLSPLVGEQLTVIAWLWARTVKSPNPAYSHIAVPLVSNFILSSKAGGDVYVDPIPDRDGYYFTVRVGTAPQGAASGTNLSRGSFRCVMSKSPIKYAYIDDEANAGRMGSRLMAVVADSKVGRVYLSPDQTQERIARQAVPSYKPEAPCRGTFASNAQGRIYGFKVFGDYFTPRQLVALSTYTDLVHEAIARCQEDALHGGWSDDCNGLDQCGTGALAYGQAIGTYLALALSRLTDICNALCRWEVTKTQVRNLFGRQAIPMNWSFAENNVFGGAAGDFATSLGNLLKALREMPATKVGVAVQADAQTQALTTGKVVSTDPPYYDNVVYADLSDFFYVWLRKCLKPIFADLYGTVTSPKTEELVAIPQRHGGKEGAELFFLNGMSSAIHRLAELAHPAFPVTVYYAFKQSETSEKDGTASTGWETFLNAVISAGFSITGTWPIRTELMTRMTGADTNALASSIALVCRKRSPDAPTISRREFIRELNAVLPEALLDMTRDGVNSPVAPVDLSQAIIGPGMAIFSKYSAVLESDGKPMSVRTALQLINRFLAEDDFDHDTQFSLRWFEGYGWNEGKYGEADVLARAKGTNISALHHAGVVESGGGIVRLLRWPELAKDWTPEKDNSTPIWEAMHQLIRALNQDGESATGALLAGMPLRAEPIRALAYRLYTLCERKGWAEDARAYNELIGAWSGIERASNETGQLFTQSQMF
jgi:putative DNA methylase